MERKKICRELLEYFLDEYTEVGKEWFINETMCPHKMLAFKKLAKMVHYAHEVYHISIELAHGTERDWHGEHEHTHKAMPDHAMPQPMDPRGYAASGRHPHDRLPDHDGNPRR